MPIVAFSSGEHHHGGEFEAVQSRDPFDRFDEAINDPRLYETANPDEQSRCQYEDPEQLQDDPLTYEPVPLFLSNYEEER